MATKKKVVQEESPKSWRANFQALQYIPRFLRKVWRTSPSMFLGNMLLRLVAAGIPIVMLWIGKLIIDEVLLLLETPNPDLQNLWFFVGLEFGLAILSDVLNRGINLTTSLVGTLYSNASSIEIIKKTAEVDLSQLEDPSFYDKLERARRQTTNRISLLSNILSQGQDLFLVGSLIAGLIVFEPWLVLLLALSIIPSFLNEIKFTRSFYTLARRFTPERRELDYLRFTGASDITAKEVKLFGLSNFIASRFHALAHKYYLETKGLSIRRSVWGASFNILGNLAYYGAYIFILLRVLAGALTVGDLTFLSGSFNRLRNQLQAMFTRFSRITESAMYLKDYFDFLDLKQDYYKTEDILPLPSTIKKGFEFKGVSFKYPGTDTYVLKDINFSLRAGEKLAFVGENGAGKTTLIKLLLRFYNLTSGEILLDDVNIQRFDKARYQQYFGVIFQDFVKFQFTAGDNIAVGKIEEKTNQLKIENAANLSLADEVVATLPERYQQQLGKRFKDGVDLSGGQWQKIALARAYMKDSNVVILDEPTSALDARAEYEAFQRFIGLTHGKTAIIISHRFSTVRMADRILVLKDGKVEELGTHDELLEKGALYAELFSLQAAGYQ